VASTLGGLEKLRAFVPAGTQVALESGTVAFHVSDLLQQLELVPRVIDAAQVRQLCTRKEQKSDRRDAAELAHGLRTQKYTAIVAIPPPGVRALRETLSRRRHFVRLRTAQVNATKRLLRAYGHPELARSLGSVRGWTALCAALVAEPTLRSHVERHHRTWECVSAEIRGLEAEIRVRCEAYHTDLARLQQGPGVGPLVAATFYAVIFDPHRFESAKHLAGYIGIVPRTDQSGDRDRHGPISKKGSSELRAMLCEAAQHARRVNSPLHPFYRKVRDRHGYKRAIIAVAHRLARTLWAMMRDGSDFDPARVGSGKDRSGRTAARCGGRMPAHA
jgi:transposase